ncbi:MAG: hypothetical protein AAFX01_06160 [Cyanobacteria bacterium J06638_28]
MSKQYATAICLMTVNVTSLGLCLAGLLLNMGWYRFLLGIFILPLLALHFGLHARIALEKKRIRQTTILYSCLSQVAIAIAFILFPDVSDAPGSRYAVFGLYQQPPDFFSTIALCGLLGAFVLTFMTLLTTRKRRTKRRLPAER